MLYNDQLYLHEMRVQLTQPHLASTEKNVCFAASKHLSVPD